MYAVIVIMMKILTVTAVIIAMLTVIESPPSARNPPHEAGKGKKAKQAIETAEREAPGRSKFVL